MGNCCSDYIINLIPGTEPEDALKDEFVIKQMTLGLSNMENKLLAAIYGKQYVHASLFISNLDNDAFENRGIVLEYGKYESKINQKGLMKYEYASGGMRYGFCTLQEYKKKLANSVSLNLELQQPLILFRDLIENLKENDNWNLKSFKLQEHNCQHFCAKVIRIVKAKYHPNCINITEVDRLKNGNKIDILPESIKQALLDNQ